MTEETNGNPSYLNGNSNTDALKTEHEIKPVVNGKVAKRKQPVGKRLRESFGLEETRTVGDYLVWDVLVPAIKDTVADVVKKGIDVFLYGGSSSARRSSYSGRSHVSYEGYYSRNRERDRMEIERNRWKYTPRPGSDFDEFIFDDKRDADMVLNELCEQIEVFGWAKCSDFYSLVGETERNFTMQGYGWDALGDARVERVREGWIVSLPRPMHRNDR